MVIIIKIFKIFSEKKKFQMKYHIAFSSILIALS
jgi:hypothetical protein